MFLTPADALASEATDMAIVVEPERSSILVRGGFVRARSRATTINRLLKIKLSKCVLFNLDKKTLLRWSRYVKEIETFVANNFAPKLCLYNN
jgi:hypothetical protein